MPITGVGVRVLTGAILIALGGCSIIPSPTAQEIPAPSSIPTTVHNPRVGVAYPLAVWTQCGVEYMFLDGDPWEFVHLGGNVVAGFDKPWDVGSIVFHDDDHATYTNSSEHTVPMLRVQVAPSPRPCA